MQRLPTRREDQSNPTTTLHWTNAETSPFCHFLPKWRLGRIAPNATITNPRIGITKMSCRFRPSSKRLSIQRAGKHSVYTHEANPGRRASEAQRTTLLHCKQPALSTVPSRWKTRTLLPGRAVLLDKLCASREPTTIDSKTRRHGATNRHIKATVPDHQREMLRMYKPD